MVNLFSCDVHYTLKNEDGWSRNNGIDPEKSVNCWTPHSLLSLKKLLSSNISLKRSALSYELAYSFYFNSFCLQSVSIHMNSSALVVLYYYLVFAL